ncbi:MAG: molybdenum ABC transporter ATP-binding protein [Halomonas sp.]|uniref:molybdenum ABC transporter ATP-binding protein n=1 Tax=Halomonas sp. TaxID=1486246 RepID=UPI00180BB148|nr:molybdenum ABC transporter ATP-binding protein [Halomonas sp.]NWN83505.1 molybdenum ABC transporter ATP-binding protein [Halomonas sp.]
MNSAASLRLALRKRLGGFHLETDLTLPDRGVSALFGASGSGKTSLLRLIAGLDRPDHGHIRLGERTLVDVAQGQWLPPNKRRIGIVFQEPRLFPHYRVRGNLTYGMPVHARPRFNAIVELLGIGSLLDRLPGTLSGGEAQRVSIGRALLSDPQLLLMDEPLSGLDGARKQELLTFILSLVRDIKIPIVYISHDPGEIIAIADHLVVIEAGRVLASDSLETVLQRLDLTPQLGGFDLASVLPAQVAGHDATYELTHLALEDGQTLVVPRLAAPPGSELRVRIPARDVGLALAPITATSYRNQLRASVERIAPSPDDDSAMELLLGLGRHRLRSRLTRKSCAELKLAPGMSVTALIRTVSFDIRRH